MKSPTNDGNQPPTNQSPPSGATGPSKSYLLGWSVLAVCSILLIIRLLFF